MKLQLYFPSSRHQWQPALFPDRDYHPIKPPLWARERFLSRRSINAVGFLCCALMLAYAYYLEFFEGLVPCPLCVLERLIVAILGFVFLLEAVHAPRRRGTARCYGALIGLVSGVGASVAGRHVWMQSRPNDDIVFCLPPLDYLLKSSPLDETLRLILSTPGDCKTIDWAMLGLSIPAWSLLGFIVLGAMGLFCNWSRD